MSATKTDQERFTHGRWQAARLRFPGRGGDPADEWVIDIVMDEGDPEEEELGEARALERYRPARGMTPDLGPVIERAIRTPMDGRPHLPAVVRVASAELAEEIRRRRPEVKIVIGPTPYANALGEGLADEVLPDADEGEERWWWLVEGVGKEQVTRLFTAFGDALETLVHDALEPGQLIRVTVKSLGLAPAWALIMREQSFSESMLLSIAIAPDEEARDAWDEDESSDTELVLHGVEQDELPPEAHAEILAHGWEPRRGLYPHVKAGGGEPRPPTSRELEIVIAVLEAIAKRFDPFAADLTPGAPRKLQLSSGAEAVVEVRPDEVLELADEEDDEDEEIEDELEFVRPGDQSEDDARFLREDDRRAWLPAPPPSQATVRAADKPGRNDPCWCGSGKKYKKCHLDADRS